MKFLAVSLMLVAVYLSLSPSVSFQSGWDKIAHFAFYSILTASLFPLIGSWSAVISSGTAGVFEILQFFVPSRQSSFMDFFSSFLGSVSTVLILSIWRCYRENTHGQAREHGVQHEDEVAGEDRPSPR